MHLDQRGSSRELTSTRLQRLLDGLSSDGRDAAERYNRVRERLVHFFAWRRCQPADELADDVIDRVARRLDEGETVANVSAFMLGVAHVVALEAVRRRHREERAATEFARGVAAADPADDEALACLERCLGTVSTDRGQNLLAYYAGDGATRIAQRRRLADALGVGATALRNRMLRLRQNLERCVDECLSRPERDGSAETRTSDVHPRSRVRGEPR